MDEVTIVGVDLAKQVFQVHGAAADGRVLFRKKLSRSQFSRFIASLPPMCSGHGGLWISALLGPRTCQAWP